MDMPSRSGWFQGDFGIQAVIWAHMVLWLSSNKMGNMEEKKLCLYSVPVCSTLTKMLESCSPTSAGYFISEWVAFGIWLTEEAV